MHAQRLLYEAGACSNPCVGVAINASGGPAGPPVSTIQLDPVCIMFIVDPYNAQCKQVTAIRSSAMHLDAEKVFQTLYKCDSSHAIKQVSSPAREGASCGVLVRNPDIEQEDADSDSDDVAAIQLQQ